MTATAYARLEERFKRIAALDDARGMLGWDQATMMPTGGAEARGEQIAAISAVRHGILTAPQTGDLLERAAAEVHLLDSWQAANLAEMKRRWRHATALDEDLVTALSRAGDSGWPGPGSCNSQAGWVNSAVVIGLRDAPILLHRAAFGARRLGSRAATAPDFQPLLRIRNTNRPSPDASAASKSWPAVSQ